MQEIKSQLKKVIQDLFGLDFDPEITPAPANIDADFSSNAPLKLAKELHKPPMEIAEKLIETFVSISDNGSAVASEPRNDGRERSGEQKFAVSFSHPGFVNFALSNDYLWDKLTNFDFKNSDYAGQTIICEFSDPNPFKVLHVGHLYTSIVGDSISRLYEYAGAKVIRANFGGDVGLHVAKTMYILRQKDPAELKIEDIAKCYVEGTAAYEDDEKAKREITKLNKEIYEINSQNLHGTPLADLYWHGRELSYDYFKQFYSQIGVTFDKFYPESTVADLGLEKVKEQLKNGVYEMSGDAVIFDGDKFGLHTRVFVNQEGLPTYEAKDVGLIFAKYRDYHFDKSVVITGNEQKDYMQVVLKSVEQYAPELVEKTTHLTHGLVKLPGNVKMSSRKGNFLKAVDVLEMVRAELRSEYNSTDERIALTATKYALIKYKMGGNIIFDPHESVKMTGNSGPYLLYSCVRAKKILDGLRVAEDGFSKGLRLGRTPLGTRPSAARSGPRKAVSDRTLSQFERNFIKKIILYKDTLAEAVSELAPHKLATYLYELAQEFSRFYENCPVAGSPEEPQRQKIVATYLNVMTHGLSILGITEIPEEM